MKHNIYKPLIFKIFNINNKNIKIDIKLRFPYIETSPWCFSDEISGDLKVKCKYKHNIFKRNFCTAQYGGREFPLNSYCVIQHKKAVKFGII